MNRKIKNKKDSGNNNTKIVATDHFIPDDEKIPVTVNDPDDLAEDDPYENPAEEPPTDGEGP